MKARRGIAGYSEDLFPDELQKLLGDRHLPKLPTQANEQMDRIFTLFEEIGAAPIGQFPETMLYATNRFFRAERSALFRYGSKKESPELLAVHNMTGADISSKSFRHSISLVHRAFQENHPVISRNHPASETGKRLSVLCLPFDAENRMIGVIYHDNVYLKDGFNIDEDILHRLSHLISAYLRRNQRHEREVMKKQSALESSISQQCRTDDYVFPTPGLKGIGILAGKVAGSDASVLICGETGTGKEVVARWIHERSSRRDKPFIVIEPSAIPLTLVESELFGHEKGAFTGANHRKIGRIELAHHGTLFIDEIGEVPEPVQVKLLRVLQEKAFTRVGGSKNIRSDFRLLAATNRNLAREISKGRFREDLYYRLNVIQITMPPLRDRREDIPLLTRHFLSHYGRKHNRPHLTLSRNDEVRLNQFDWPGNVRELKNIIERAVLLSGGNALELDVPSVRAVVCREKGMEDWPDMEEMQRRYILSVLEKTGGKISGTGGAAEILGMKRTTFNARLKKLGLR